MCIEELTAGLGVTFYVNIVNEQQLTFESKITEVNPKKQLVLAEAIIKDDKVLSFKSKTTASTYSDSLCANRIWKTASLSTDSDSTTMWADWKIT